MLKKTVTYENFNGDTVTEDFYFNYTKAELSDKQFSVSGGLSHLLEEIMNTNDTTKQYSLFREIILSAYGQKSADGKFFRKSAEISEDFAHTEAYSTIFMELLNSEDAAVAFISGILPKDMQSNVRAGMKKELAKITKDTGVDNVNTAS